MKSLTHTLATTTLALFVLTACGSFSSHRLPVPAHKARNTFSPIASVADSKGLRYAEHDTSINVQLDDATWVYYTIQNDRFNMVISIDDDMVPEPERQDKLAWGKTQGDEIWQEAMLAYKASSPY